MNIHFMPSFRVGLQTIVAGLTSVVLLSTSSFALDGEKISKRLQYALDNTEGDLPVIVMMRQLPPLPHSFIGQVPRAQIEGVMKQKIYKLQMDLRSRVSELTSTRTMNGDAGIRNARFFWIVNAMKATASREVIAELADREDVTMIDYDRRINLFPEKRVMAEPEGGEFTYGLQKIGAAKLRESNPEINGQGVIVGLLDTGIDASHPEFAGKHIVFKNFVSDQQDPFDDHGHGTHCSGTIMGLGAGSTQIGVAPGINQYVVGKVFTAYGGGSESGLLRGMEWMADPDGKPETADQPRVVNNSWGGPLYDSVDEDPFSPAVSTWVQLNIFPSFAAGNEGPGKGTVGSPGGLPQAFAVGATNAKDKAANFSSRGPVDTTQGGQKIHLTKPDLSAPGEDVFSAMPNGEYGYMSGTSMATPHNTGAVALLVQVKPDLTVPQIRELLEKTSDDLGDQGKDNTFGAGRLNVAHAYEILLSKMQ